MRSMPQQGRRLTIGMSASSSLVAKLPARKRTDVNLLGAPEGAVGVVLGEPDAILVWLDIEAVPPAAFGTFEPFSALVDAPRGPPSRYGDTGSGPSTLVQRRASHCRAFARLNQRVARKPYVHALLGEGRQR